MPGSRHSLVAFAVAALAAPAILVSSGCAGHLRPKPEVFESHQETITVSNNPLRLTVVKPARPAAPPFMVVFASGDGGLLGVSKAVLQHLADRGYAVVGFSSPDAFEGVVSASKGRPNYAAARDAVGVIIAHAKRSLGLPENTPTVITGLSRGASVVVAAAGDPVLQQGIAGAIAIALTREFDELTIPDEAMRLPVVQTDEKGRIQVYPAIQRLGAIPLAVIQSTKDSYVTSAESRQLLGPNTPTRRLYEVPSDGHSFGGGEDLLMRDLDDAMTWILTLHNASR